MTLRQYLIVMGLGTILCATALGMVMFQVDPFRADVVTFSLFYACVFCTLIGLFSLITLPVIQAISTRRGTLLHRHVAKSVRISMYVAFLLTIFLFLRGARLLSPVSGLTLLAFIALIITVRITTKKKPDLLIV